MLALLFFALLQIVGSAVHQTPFTYQKESALFPAVVSGTPAPSGFFKYSWPDSIAGTNVESISIDRLGEIYAVCVPNQLVVVSKNGGKTWEESLTTNGLLLRSIIVGDNVLAGGLGVGTFWAPIGTEDWVHAVNGLPNSLWVTSYSYNPKFGTVFMSTADGDGLYRSTDAGVTWIGSSNGYPPSQISSIIEVVAVDTASGDVYFGAGGFNGNGSQVGAGVWRSTDNGSYWSHIGLDGYYITSLAVWRGVLYAATFGSGIFYLTGDSTWHALPSPNVGSPTLCNVPWVLYPTPFGMLVGYQYAGIGAFLLRGSLTNPQWNYIGLFQTSVYTFAVDSAGYLYAGTWAPDVGGVWKSIVPLRQIAAKTNSPPKIVSRTPAFGGEIGIGVPIKFSVTAMDSDGDSLSYRWGVDGDVIDSAKADSMLYTFLGIGAEPTVTCIVTDSFGAADSTTWSFVVTNVKENGRPTEFALSQNYPNPFNPTTTVSYTLPKRANVNLTVYNVLGRKVAILADGEFSPGQHQAVFDASRLPSGTYFYRLQAGSFVETKKMVLMK